MHSITLAATGITGGQFLGAITLSGAALVSGTGMVLGLRGSDFGPIVIDNKKKAAWWGIITGTIWVAAGGTWASMANGIGSVPTSVFTNSADLGNPGQGGIATFLVLCAFGPRWKKKVFPALFGIAGAVTFGTAGGVWGIFVNVIKMIVGIATGQG